jgi:hypothetical protein
VTMGHAGLSEALVEGRVQLDPGLSLPSPKG